VAGALPEAEWVAILKKVGFEQIRVADVRWDSFRGAPKESADAIELGAECIALSAIKPRA
jgi:hypothetical protein